MSKREQDLIYTPMEFKCRDLDKVSYPFSDRVVPTKCRIRGFELDCNPDGCPMMNISHLNIAGDESIRYCGDEHYPQKCPSRPSRSNKISMRTIAIAVGVSGGFLVSVICMTAFLWYRQTQQTSSTSEFIPRIRSSDPSNSNSNLPTHIFSYDEIKEATNNFNESNELGEGSSGVVYHGKLCDGRTVAVKRLNEDNYRRVEQFMNEVEILSCLRHQNHVSLFGCTSRHNHELLLVYEFVPNGTVADHIHGDSANSRALTWPIRMNIAIEIVDALAYLHAAEIVHRDVKSSNILLDENFHVKVDDFGLSRLFPWTEHMYQLLHKGHWATLIQTIIDAINSLTRVMFTSSEWFCSNLYHQSRR